MSSTSATTILPAPRQLTFAISGVFLAIIVSLPLVQLVSEIQLSLEVWPTAFRLLPAIPRTLAAGEGSAASAYSRIMAANRQLCEEFRSYELHVTQSAWPINRPRAWLQAGLTGPLRSGNEQVVVGPDGWLFFRPDVEGLTGPGFLEPQVVRLGLGTAPRHTNPLPAIKRFAADLQARGIELILVPIPSKAGMLGRGRRKDTTDSPIHNASFQQFLTELDQHHIRHCDLTATLFGAGEKSVQTTPHYLKTDSHWTPAGMQLAAQFIAEQVGGAENSGRRPLPRYETKKQTVENIGDTARLLGSDIASQVITPEWVEITQVDNLDHSHWAPDPQAEILLLGDSFLNIYSHAELGWGASAGFAEHLSLALNQPVDRIALNAGGAVAARRELLRQSQQSGSDRLAGKKIVIWPFAERELALGDWQVLPLPAPVKNLPTTPQSPAVVTIEGVIAQAGQLPNPATLPYREALIPLYLQSVKTTTAGKIPEEIVVYVWGMQDRQLTPLAAWKSGQRVHLKLVPWSTAEREFGRFARAELDDPDFRLIDLPTYWGTP